MTTENNFERTNRKVVKLYKIWIEGEVIYVDSKIVDEIVFETQEDKRMILKILSYIAYSVKSINANVKKNKVRSFNQELIVESLIKLIKHYSVEMVKEIFQGLKWQDMFYIIYSYDPIRVLDEII